MNKVSIEIDLYRFISEKIEESVTGYLLNRATKYVEDWSYYDPEHKRRELAEKIASEVMGDLCEWIRFTPDDSGPA